jgi:hypothetical protein
MKKQLSIYISECVNFWFNIAPANDYSNCSRKRGCISTVKDFDVKFIQPATEKLAAARIVGNNHMLQSILPPENSDYFEPLQRQYQQLINSAVNYVQHEPVSNLA